MCRPKANDTEAVITMPATPERRSSTMDANTFGLWPVVLDSPKPLTISPPTDVSGRRLQKSPIRNHRVPSNTPHLRFSALMNTIQRQKIMALVSKNTMAAMDIKNGSELLSTCQVLARSIRLRTQPSKTILKPKHSKKKDTCFVFSFTQPSLSYTHNTLPRRCRNCAPEVRSSRI